MSSTYLIQLAEYVTVTKRLAAQVCRHHAAAVAEGCGHAAEFTCPYHGCALWIERCSSDISLGFPKPYPSRCVCVCVKLLPSWKLSCYTQTKQTFPTWGLLKSLKQPLYCCTPHPAILLVQHPNSDTNP